MMKKSKSLFGRRKQNYVAYYSDFDSELLEVSLGQLNEALKCNDDFDEKIKQKYTSLLMLKRFEEAKKIAKKHHQLDYLTNSFSITNGAFEYASLLECYIKNNEQCVKKSEFSYF